MKRHSHIVELTVWWQFYTLHLKICRQFILLTESGVANVLKKKSGFFSDLETYYQIPLWNLKKNWKEGSIFFFHYSQDCAYPSYQSAQIYSHNLSYYCTAPFPCCGFSWDRVNSTPMFGCCWVMGVCVWGWARLLDRKELPPCCCRVRFDWDACSLWPRHAWVKSYRLPMLISCDWVYIWCC